MAKRKRISDRTKLAAALLALGHVPHEHAKLMTADQIISLYHFDHNILHALDPIDEPWNLAPVLIAPHRQKSRKDTGIVAKVRRVEPAWREFNRRMAEKTGQAPRTPAKPKSRWGSRPLRSQSRWSKRK